MGWRPRTGHLPTATGRPAPRIVLMSLLIGITRVALAAAGSEPPSSPRFNLELVAESYANLAGGLQRGSDSNAVVDATFSLANRDLGWQNDGYWFLDLKHIRGADPSQSLSGDVQVASNIAAPAANRIYEFWYQQTFWTPQVSLRAGIIDLNKVFGVVPGSGGLNNSSFGIQPALSLNAPSSIFPKPGWALVGASQIGNRWRLQLGWFQGHPAERSRPFGNGHMLVGELLRDAGGDASLLMLGAWRYTQPNGAGYGDPGSDWGAYAAWSTQLADARKRVFLQAGASPVQASFSPYYLETGYSWRAPLHNRPDDRLNLGLARCWVRSPNGIQAETVLETNYRFAINPQFALAPDVQYILQPARPGTTSPGNAWVMMLRLYFSLD